MKITFSSTRQYIVWVHRKHTGARRLCKNAFGDWHYTGWLFGADWTPAAVLKSWRVDAHLRRLAER